MKNRQWVIIGSTVIIIVIVFAAVFFSRPTTTRQENTNAQNKNGNAVIPTLTLDDSFGDLFSSPKNKETTFYEMAFLNDLSDPTRAAKLRKVQFSLEQKAKAGDKNAQTVLDEFSSYKQDTNNALASFQKQSCADLEKQLLQDIPVEVFMKSPARYQKQIEQIASPDYIEDLSSRKTTVLLKKALLDNEEKSCKTLGQMLRQKTDELKTKGDLGPLPPTPEIIKRADLDLAGRDPVSTEFYVPELDAANVRPSFSNYALSNRIELPESPSQKLPLYQLYSFLKFKDVADLAKTFGIQGNPQKNDFMSYTIEGKDGSYLEANQMSGVFTYGTPAFSDAVTGASPETLSQEQKNKLSQTARDFLESKKLLPSPVTMPHYYQKKGSSSLFVEFKMGDEKSGLIEHLNGIPIINNDKIQLEDPLLFPPALEYRSRDEKIVNTSDHLDGFARSDNQNTVTVEIQPASKRIIGVKYNLRRIKRVLPEVDVMTARQAFEQLQKGKGVLFDIIPADNAQADWKTIFPASTAQSSEVTVDQVYLGYVNKTHLFPQEYLVPAYIFKGTAKLSSGNTAKFTAVVSALVQKP